MMAVADGCERTNISSDNGSPMSLMSEGIFLLEDVASKRVMNAPIVHGSIEVY